MWSIKVPWGRGVQVDLTLIRVEDKGPNLVTMQEVRVTNDQLF